MRVAEQRAAAGREDFSGARCCCPCWLCSACGSCGDLCAIVYAITAAFVCSAGRSSRLARRLNKLPTLPVCPTQTWWRQRQRRRSARRRRRRAARTRSSSSERRSIWPVLAGHTVVPLVVCCMCNAIAANQGKAGGGGPQRHERCPLAGSGSAAGERAVTVAGLAGQVSLPLEATAVLEWNGGNGAAPASVASTLQAAVAGGRSVPCLKRGNRGAIAAV